MILIGGMFLGGKLQQTMPNKTNPLQKVDRQKLSRVLELIDQKYVDSTNYDDLVGSAISGILKKLDPHSVFVAAQDFDNVNENLEGNFEGIGSRFCIVNDTIIVVSPITGGPSADLGIKPGDKIIFIEGAGLQNTADFFNDPEKPEQLLQAENEILNNTVQQLQQMVQQLQNPLAEAEKIKQEGVRWTNSPDR